MAVVAMVAMQAAVAVARAGEVVAKAEEVAAKVEAASGRVEGKEVGAMVVLMAAREQPPPSHVDAG